MNFDFRKYRFTLFLLIIVVAMGLELIYLMAQNRKLRGIISACEGNYKTLKQDESVPQFSARDLNGNAVTLQYSSSQPYTMLMWFSATCSACEDNLHFWNDLYRGYNSGGLRFLGVCLDDSAQAQILAKDYELIFPIVCLDDQALVDAYSGYTLPQMMLISPQGAILKVWRGSLKEENKASVAETLAQFESPSGKGGDIQ